MEPLTDEMKEKMIESINKKIREQRKILRDLPAMERNRADGKAQKRVKSANYRGEADKSHQAIENLQNKLKFIDSYEDEIKAAKSDAERESINARMQGIIQQEYYGISPRAVKLAAEKAKKQEAQQENVSKGISDDARNNLINNVNNFINQTDLTEEEKANLRSFYTDYASSVMDEKDIAILRAELNDSINEMRERRNIENQVNDEQEENKIIDDDQKENQMESPFASISNDDISMYMQAIEGRYNLAFDRLKGKSGQELNDNLALANNLNSLKNQLLDFEKNAKNANTPEEIAKYEEILKKAKEQYKKYQNEINELQRKSEVDSKGKGSEGAKKAAEIEVSEETREDSTDEKEPEEKQNGINELDRNNLINSINNFINQTDLTEEEKANLRSFYADYASNVMDEEDISILRADLNDSINEMRERRNIENQVNDEQEENKIIDDEQKENQPESPFANISNDDISMYMQALEGRRELARNREKGRNGQAFRDDIELENNMLGLEEKLRDFAKNAKNANTQKEIDKYEKILENVKIQYQKYQNELNELQRQSEEEKTKGKSPEGATEGVVKAEAEEERISILCDATYGIYKVSGKDITLNSNNKDVIRENRKLKKEIRTSYGLSRADMKHLDLNAYRLLNKASKDQAEEYINSIKNRDNSEYKSDRKFDLVYDFRENDLESFKDIGKKTNFLKKWALKRLASRGEEMGVAKVADTMYLSEGLDYDKYLKENSPEEKKFSKEEKNKEKNLINDLQDYTYSIEEAEITAAQMKDFVIDPKDIKDFAINPEDIENMKHQDTKGEDDTAPVM
ncbi:unknown [Clostridium sp. CAG:921]|nr:unknown [Clostridium sp. CAG:921]